MSAKNTVLACLLIVIGIRLFSPAPADGQDQPISLTIQGGRVVIDGKEREVGPGTFIPAPYDADLAKKIIECHAEYDKLKVMLDSCEKKFVRYDEYWDSREKKLIAFYEKDQERLARELERATGWWNEWGKPVLSAILSAAVATITTWGIMR